MAKIVNIKTGKVRETIIPEPSDCTICSNIVHEIEGGINDTIDELSVSFCGRCISGIITILMERQNR
jgi:hypothetical protein